MPKSSTLILAVAPGAVPLFDWPAGTALGTFTETVHRKCPRGFSTTIHKSDTVSLFFTGGYGQKKADSGIKADLTVAVRVISTPSI
jgi:hypothetical protein